MAAPLEAGSYKEVILFLATAGIIVPVFSRLRVSPVLGFIGAGALIGPFGLGRFTDVVPALAPFTIPNRDEFAHLAELGVVFLLFTIGLELSFERLRTLRRLVFGLGAAQVALSAALLAGAGMLLGLPAGTAQIGGIALALSSTAIVIPILAGQRRLASPTGRASFSVLLFQDLAVAPLLFTIAALGSAKGDSVFLSILTSLAQAGIALVAIVAIGRVALRPLFHLVAQTGSSELFMAACFLIVIASALVAASAGLSMALGAFVAGLLLAETEFRRAIEAVVEPFKGLLLGVFFLSVGMALDVSALGRAPLTILAVASGLVVIKAAVIVALAFLFRLPPRVGLETALLLGGAGEFAFVIVGAAAAANLMTGDVAQAYLVVTTVSMIALPLFARIGRRLGQRLAAAAAAPVPVAPSPPEATGRVLLAGFGRVGQLVADMLERHGVPYLALDANPALVAAQRAAGKPVYFGDSASLPFLQACGLDGARALVITLDSPAVLRTTVEAVRTVRPDITIVARARDARHACQLYAIGVNDAVPETIEASLQLSEAVLVDIGIAMGPVIASIHERRDEFRRALQKPASDSTATEAAEAPREAGEFRARRSTGKRTA